MSHVVKLKGIPLTDLDLLATAAESLGCELVRDQTTHLYYAGNRAKCAHVIRVKNATARTYEIGVLVNKDGTFALQADFFNGGHGLQEMVGEDGKRLFNEYAVQTAIQHLTSRGYRPSRWVNAEGNVVVSTETRF